MFAKDTPYGILSSSLIHISWFSLPLGERERMRVSVRIFFFGNTTLICLSKPKNFPVIHQKKKQISKGPKGIITTATTAKTTNEFLVSLILWLLSWLLSVAVGRLEKFLLLWQKRGRERVCVNEWLNVRFLVPFHWKLKKLLTLFKYLMR